MTTNVSAHEDNNNSSALILVQTKYPPDPEHTPNSKFFHSDRWFRKEEIMNRGIKLLKIDTYLATGAQSSLLGFKSWVCLCCARRREEDEREREREERELVWRARGQSLEMEFPIHTYLISKPQKYVIYPNFTLL